METSYSAYKYSFITSIPVQGSARDCKSRQAKTRSCNLLRLLQFILVISATSNVIPTTLSSTTQKHAQSQCFLNVKYNVPFSDDHILSVFTSKPVTFQHDAKWLPSHLSYGVPVTDKYIFPMITITTSEPVPEWASLSGMFSLQNKLQKNDFTSSILFSSKQEI